MNNTKTVAYNVEGARELLWQHAQIPPELLNDAIAQLHKHVTAKKTLFFTHQGDVVSKVNVEDHTTQQSAIDKILSIGGAYAREADKPLAVPHMELSVDTKTGVVRLITGTRPALVETPLLALAENPPTDLLRQGVPMALEEELEPEVILVSKGGLPIEVFNQLFPPKEK